jgi:hypothetical protein
LKTVVGLITPFPKVVFRSKQEILDIDLGLQDREFLGFWRFRDQSCAMYSKKRLKSENFLLLSCCNPDIISVVSDRDCL